MKLAEVQAGREHVRGCKTPNPEQQEQACARDSATMRADTHTCARSREAIVPSTYILELNVWRAGSGAGGSCSSLCAAPQQVVAPPLCAGRTLRLCWDIGGKAFPNGSFLSFWSLSARCRY